jgi:hypothetical protein
MAKRKTWREKLRDSKGLPKVQPIESHQIGKWGDGTLVIPAPLELDEVMRQVPLGKLITINGIRERLARKHGATVACPITCGIFAWISAHAAEESAEQGELKITPYWRTLKNGGEINAKYPGGIDHVRARLEAEGHKVAAKGKRWVVEGYERSLA